MEVIDAIASADVKLVEELVAGPKAIHKINDTFTNGKTPLLCAIENKQPQMASLLIKVGANVNKTCHKMYPNPWFNEECKYKDVNLLQTAIDLKHPEMVYMLLSKGAKLSKEGIGMHELLHRAIKWNSPELVYWIVTFMQDDDMCIVKKCFDLNPHLLTAVYDNNLHMGKLLIDLGANPNHPHNNMLPLVVAANNGNIRMCVTLLNVGAQVNIQSSCILGHANTPLGMAICAGMQSAVQRLILLKADVNASIDGYMTGVGTTLQPGSTMLHLAVHKKQKSVLEILLAAGADICGVNKAGDTVLHTICSDPSGNAQSVVILKYLLNYSKQYSKLLVNKQNDFGMTALMIAVQHRNVDAVTHLLVYKADVHVKNSKKENALYIAVEKSCEDIVFLLLQAGSHVNSVNAGKNLILLSVCNGDMPLTETLLEHRANLRAVDRNNHTALHLAVLSKSEDMVQLCLSYKLCINQRSYTGDTALMLAARQNTETICETLLNNGARMNFYDRKLKETALSLSVYFGYEQNSRILIMHGANVNIPDKR